MQDMMEDVWIPAPSSPMVFTRCDICDKDYLAPESQINNPTSAISEEELEEQVHCFSCAIHAVRNLKYSSSKSQ